MTTRDWWSYVLIVVVAALVFLLIWYARGPVRKLRVTEAPFSPAPIARAA